MDANERSKHITEGVERSPNRAMYYAMGYTKQDFNNPMIGIANGHSTITPCNSGLQKLADAAIAATKAAGGNPQVFGTPTISDGMSMGTEGMKYSLISREVIADSIETCVQGQWMDGCVVIGGCDKNMPGGMIALARINVPGIYVYGGTIRPGKWKGQDLNIVSAFEAVCTRLIPCPRRSRRSVCPCCTRQRWRTQMRKKCARPRSRRACWFRR